MSVLLIILIIFVTLVIVTLLSATITLWHDFKYYKKTYDELPNMKFCWFNPKFFGTQIYSFNPLMKNRDKFIWFVQTSDFHLEGTSYIHNALFTYFSPYTLYWFIKYKKWFKKNVEYRNGDIYKINGRKVEIIGI